MREIKFRCFVNSCYYPVRYLNYNANGELINIAIIEQVGESDWDFPCTSEDYVLEQYTGLKDKNGKEIYEGDIVKFGKFEMHIVVFARGCFLAEDYDNGDYYSGTDPLCTHWDTAEVIGNIHENPDIKI